MRFAQPLVQGRLIKRYKRFLADVTLADGERVTAHCANPGAMTTCMETGGRVWLSRSDNPARKLAYTWELSEVGDALVCVNTSRANEMVAEALAEARIPELAGYQRITREVRYGERSRIDFLLERDSSACYVEVKSVSLAGGPGIAAFPDSITVRGRRHLEELMDMVRAGHRAVLLFVCNRSDASAVRPADEVDPLYGQTLRQAAAAGVEILAYRSALDPMAITLADPVPVRLPALTLAPQVRPTGVSDARTSARPGAGAAVGGKKRGRVSLRSPDPARPG